MAFGSSLASLAGAAGGNYVGGALVRLLLDAAQFDTGLKSAESRLLRWGGKVSRAGTVMTRGLTLPIIGAGAAALKMAMDYETAFTRIAATTNASESTIRAWKKEVLGLAEATGKSPRELAGGLYYLASAGLKANQIMPTLEMTAKASAAGLGEVGDIARLTANVLNAYADSGMTAKRSMDILFAAIKEGTANPDEFANAMGRILPIASKAGVGFDELAGSLASLSNIGLDVNEGVTAMRGLLQALVAPGTAAANTMKDIGISADQMRRVISEDGILGALKLLEDRTGGNIDLLRKIIPNIRGLTGQLALTGPKADAVSAAFDRITKSKGDLDKGFRETKKDPAFQWQQILARLQVQAIKLGKDLLPVAADIGDAISEILGWIDSLDAETRGEVIKWAAIVAGVGPVLKILGTFMQVGASVVKFMKTTWGPGIAAGAAALAGIAISLRRADAAADGFYKKLTDSASIKMFGDDIEELVARHDSLIDKMKIFVGIPPATLQLDEYLAEIDEARDRLGSLPPATREIERAQLDMSEAMILAKHSAEHLSEAEADLASERKRGLQSPTEQAAAQQRVNELRMNAAYDADQLEKAEKDLTTALKDQAVASAELQTREEDRAETRDRLASLADDVASAELDIRDAMRQLKDERKALEELEKRGVTSGRKYKEQRDAVTRSELALEAAQRRQRDSVRQLADQTRGAANVGHASQKAFVALADAFGLSNKEIKGLISDIPGASAQIKELGEKGDLTKKQVEILEDAVAALQEQISRTPKAIMTRFYNKGLNEGIARVNDYKLELVGLDGKVVTVTYKYFGQVTGEHPTGTGGHVVGRQVGGSRHPGEWYMAGERGAELIQAGRSGHFVHDDHATRRILAAAHGGDGITVNIGNVYGADPRAVREAARTGAAEALEAQRRRKIRHDRSRGRVRC